MLNNEVLEHLQMAVFGLTGAAVSSEIELSERLEIGYINEQAKADLVAFQRAGYFLNSQIEFLVENYSTAGTGHPLRMIAYYNRQPIAYLIGTITNQSIDIYFWELSRNAPKDFELKWPKILISALENISIALSSVGFKIEYIAFTSPDPCEMILWRDLGMSYTDDYLGKGIPAVVLSRK